MTIETKLKELGIEIPEISTPVANYIPAIIVGNELRTSGQIPMLDGELQFKGCVPSEQSVENAVSAARLCGINAIASAGALLGGDLNRITRVTQLKVYVASDIGFEGHSTIANGASDLMVAIFGDAGRSIRVAMGAIGLPLGSTVEVEAIFEVRNA